MGSADGTCLFESDAIAFYVASAQMRGGQTSGLDQALVTQWMSFAQNEVLPSACTWVFPTMGVMQFNKTATDRAKEEVKKAMEVLDKHLLTRTYLVGERITLADVCVAYAMKMLFENVLDAAFRKPFGNTVRWYTTIMNQPQVVCVSGQPKLCEKMAQFDAKKYAEMSGKGDNKKQKEAKKEQQPKKQEPPKKQEAKKEASPAADEPMAKPKPDKDPFAALPAGTFVMDEFKRMFSNNKEDVSLPWFWENFDHDNYSIWHCEYMYPQELKLTFMSCNLITGMMQRLDKMRKHAFGCVCVFGKSNDSTISGIWVWRGQDLAFERSEDLQIDYSSYKWTKMDSKSEETKQAFKEMVTWNAKDKDGRECNDGSIFK